MGRSPSPSSELKALAAQVPDPGHGALSPRNTAGAFAVPMRSLAAVWTAADRAGDRAAASTALRAISVLDGNGPLSPAEAYDLAVMLTDEMQAVCALTAESVRLRNEAAASPAITSGGMPHGLWLDLRRAMERLDAMTERLEDPAGIGLWPVCDGTAEWLDRYREAMDVQAAVLSRIELSHRRGGGRSSVPTGRYVVDGVEV